VLEKLTGSQLVKKCPSFYGIRRFITAFTSARHLSLSWYRSIQFTPPHPISWRSILVLSSHPRLGLPSDIFLSGFPTKSLYTHTLSNGQNLEAEWVYVCNTPSSDSFRSCRYYVLWWKGITASVTQALMFKHYFYSLTQTWPTQKEVEMFCNILRGTDWLYKHAKSAVCNCRHTHTHIYSIYIYIHIYIYIYIERERERERLNLCGIYYQKKQEVVTNPKV